MAALVNAMQPEGDAAFVRVDTRRPAHELEPGVAADAVNKRCEDGRAWPRFGVSCQPWGRPATNLVAAGATWPGPQPDGWCRVVVSGLVAGRKYRFEAGNAVALTDANVLVNGQPGGNSVAAGASFTADATTYYLFAQANASGQAVTAQVFGLLTPRGFRRFKDPDGFDSVVLVTDDWRDGVGEDGGRGRVYRIVSGQAPQAVPLNGHDVDGECRLVPCQNGLLLLRQGNERHYFNAAAVNIAGSYLALNCTPDWADGDLVLFVQEANSYITGASPPNNLTLYYVKGLGSNHYQLYTDAGLTTALSFTGGTALGSFYLERRASQPGYFGNGAPPLLMQPAGAQTCWEAGFVAAPLHLSPTAFDATNHILSLANHRLVPGDGITYTHSDTTVETFYVYPVSNDAVVIYDTAANALGQVAAGLKVLTPVFNAADTVVKKGASATPCPPAREGCYTEVNRTVLVNGLNNLVISDPLDPLHYTPLASEVTAALGESDAVTTVAPFGKDMLAVAKGGELHALVNFSQGPTAWALVNITREYGIGAPLSVTPIGKDLWGFGRKGVVSLQETEFGEVIGVALPTSYDMKKYLDLVDWGYGGQVCAEAWNNRFFVALPLRNQGTAAGVNNAVLVHNFLNADLSAGKHAWEGVWTGAALQVYAFAKLTVYGEERLCFVNYDGQVCWFTDAWSDEVVGAQPVAIADRLTTRVYGGASKRNKKWLVGRVNWDTQAAQLTVTAVAPGVNQTAVLLQDFTYDKTAYKVYGKGPYDPGAPAGPPGFGDPDREDYAPSIGELGAAGVALDLHQNTTEPLRLRVNAWGLQLVIENKAGSARVGAVELEWAPGMNLGRS